MTCLETTFLVDLLRNEDRATELGEPLVTRESKFERIDGLALVSS